MQGVGNRLPAEETMARSGERVRIRLRESLLVLRCQAGDEAAFSDLYDRFGPRSLRYLEGILGPEVAADVHQEVWLAVFRRISELTNPGAFRTWLYRTTRHRAIDALRRRKRETELLGPVNGDDVELAQNPPDLFLEAETRRVLEAGMAELAAPHREVLILRYWEEMSYADIALVAGCSLGTIRSRLHHAKKRLREVVAHSGLGHHPASSDPDNDGEER
jgi:RNA polymerase sigma-70 factor (ECF subfamily)